MNDRALKILEQYELDVDSARRGRGSWYLDTSQGFRILSDYSGSENRARFQNHVMERIRDGGYWNVDMIVPDREGTLVARDREENCYVVKEWYAGRECDTSNEGEILTAVRNLARLHTLMRIDRDQLPEGISRDHYASREPLDEVSSWNAQLRKIRSFIRSRPGRTVFEQNFLDCYERYSVQALEAEKELSGITDRLAVLRKENDNAVCHGDYSHHHVLICGCEAAATNFDRCRFDYQVSDLYYFMRKILEKHEWNIRLGMRMIDSYVQIRTLSGTERSLLRIRMLYPEKFRKLAGSYYVGSKAWISRRYVEKLEKTNRQERARQDFIKML